MSLVTSAATGFCHRLSTPSSLPVSALIGKTWNFWNSPIRRRASPKCPRTKSVLKNNSCDCSCLGSLLLLHIRHSIPQKKPCRLKRACVARSAIEETAPASVGQLRTSIEQRPMSTEALLASPGIIQAAAFTEARAEQTAGARRCPQGHVLGCCSNFSPAAALPPGTGARTACPRVFPPKRRSKGRRRNSIHLRTRPPACAADRSALLSRWNRPWPLLHSDALRLGPSGWGRPVPTGPRPVWPHGDGPSPPRPAGFGGRCRDALNPIWASLERFFKVVKNYFRILFL